MSGFEIAGLILGVVPLTIAALEQYKTAHAMLRYFKHKSEYIDRLIQALEEQKFFLESEFDILLRAARFQQQDISTSSGEYLQTMLLRSEVAEELNRYLGRGYDLYRKALIRCENALGEIVKNIGGLVPGSPSDDLKEVLRANERKEGKYEFKKRIKFSLKKDELERRISRLIETTDTLRRLRETSASQHDDGIPYSSRTIAKFAIFLQRVQRHANSLYGAVAQRLASGCHYEHGTKFYLEGQSAVLYKKPLPINFNLTLEAPEAHTVEGNLRHEVRIEVLEDHAAEANFQQPPEQSRVRFNLPDSSKSLDPSMTEVANLCLSLHRARQDRKILRVFLSQHGGLCCCPMPPIPGGGIHPSDSTYEMITLEQILLQTSSDKPSSVRWNLIQRMNLSFSLASSLLQLYSTPWLSEPWTKRTICFWRLRPSSQANDMVVTFEPDRPFIVHKFSEASTARPKYKVDAKYQLLDLGIVLLEIRHKLTFESWASAHHFTLDSSYGSRYNAARTWLRDSDGEVELSYFDAAARCIECTFQTRSAIPNWEDLEFRTSVCELVIKPLWSNCSTTVI